MGTSSNVLQHRVTLSEKFTDSSTVLNSNSLYPRWEGRTLSVVAFVMSLIAGYQLVFKLNQVYGDAMSRILTGMYIFWNGNFHLAAMSFYWSPLISLLAIPFALVRQIWSPLMGYGFASNILSAAFSAIGIYYMHKILWRFGIPTWARITLSLLYFFNPLIFLYSSNGMSDGMACALIIASIEGLVDYLQNDNIIGIVRGGAWLAAAFMVRYEAVPIGAGLGIGLAIAVWRQHKQFNRALGVALTYLFPAISAGIIWILLNWMIMKNPLYFMNSRYSNAAQIRSGTFNTPQVMAADHHFFNALGQVLHFSDNFWPIFPAIIIILILYLRKTHNISIGLSLALGSIGAPLLQLLLLYTHRSADWDRFFIYYIPFGVITTSFVLYQITKTRLIHLVSIIACVIFISADYVAARALISPIWGNGEQQVINALTHHGSATSGTNHLQNVFIKLKNGRNLALYINDHPHLKVLLSSFSSWAAFPYIKNQNQVIFSNLSDFNATLENPRGRVNAILAVPINAYSQTTDEVSVTYPNMWSGGVPWTKLIHQFSNGSRLYEVLPDAP